MKKALLTSVLALTAVLMIHAGLKPGDSAVTFNLKNVDGNMVSLSDYSDQKGLIVVFTCNPCPFSKAYEKRIIQLNEKYRPQGFPVVAINSNDPVKSPDDTFELMQKRASEKGYPFPYLKDDQDIYKAYGATRTPQVFLLENKGGNFKVAYMGAIDDNAMDAAEVISTKYLEKAITAVKAGLKPTPDTTRAIGCTIKAKA